MLIARYGLSELHKTADNHYHMQFRSCSSSGYADSDADAIAIFAQWCRTTADNITVV